MTAYFSNSDLIKYLFSHRNKPRFIALVGISICVIIALGYALLIQFPSNRELQVTLLQGTAQIKSKNTTFELQSQHTNKFLQGEILEIAPDSVALIQFQSGRSLTITKPSLVRYAIIKNEVLEQIYVFEDVRTGVQFEYNEKSGLKQVDATVLSDSNDSNSRVLGVFEENPITEHSMEHSNQNEVKTDNPNQVIRKSQ